MEKEKDDDDNIKRGVGVCETERWGNRGRELRGGTERNVNENVKSERGKTERVILP
jgi:hypothetical protein